MGNAHIVAGWERATLLTKYSNGPDSSIVLPTLMFCPACVYVCVCVCMCSYVCVPMYEYVCTCMCACACMYMSVYVHV